MISSRLLLFGLASAVIALSSCTNSTETSTSTTADAPPAAPPDGSVPPGDVRRIQDAWTYERIYTVDLDGNEVDLTGTIIDRVSPDGAAVQIADRVVFRSVSALDARMLDGDGSVRPDVSVEAGIVDNNGKAGLLVVATPDDASTPAIDDNDLIDLDLTVVEDLLQPGDPLVVDFTFAVTTGPDGERPPATGIELYRSRMAVGRMSYAATPTGAIALFRANIGEAIDGSVRGTIPAKARPMLDGFVEGIDACSDGGPLIDCIGDYHEAFREGAEESLDRMSQQLDPPSPPGTPGGDPSGEGPGGEEPPGVPAVPSDPAGGGGEPPGDGDDGGGDGEDGGSGFTPSPDVKAAECETNCPGDPPTPLWCAIPFACDPPAPVAQTPGDPHFVTFDRVRYDLQAVGEFLAATSDGWDLQLRFGPAHSGRSASVTTAAAVRFGTSVVTVDAREEPESQVRVDGEPIHLANNAGVVEIDGLVLRRWRSQVQIVDPDIGQVSLDVRGRRMSVYVVSFDPTRRWSGLYGDGDGDSTNDFALRDGGNLGPSPDFATIHGAFADSWRLTQSESMLPYRDGETTSTFTDLSFPDLPTADAVVASPLLQRARALCRIAGIASEAARGDCVADYALTGDADYVRDAQRRQNIERLLRGEGRGWMADTPGLIVLPTSAALADDELLLTLERSGDDTELVARSIGTGAILWRTQQIAPACQPALGSEYIVAQLSLSETQPGESSVPLVALDRASGRELARFGPPDLGVCRGQMGVLDDGGVVHAVRAVRRALDIDGGVFNERWRHDSDEGLTGERGARFFDESVTAGDSIFMWATESAGPANSVVAYSFDGVTGDPNRVELPLGVNPSPAGVAIGKGTAAVFGADTEGDPTITVLSPGAPLWTRSFGEQGGLEVSLAGVGMDDEQVVVAGEGLVVAAFEENRGHGLASMSLESGDPLLFTPIGDGVTPDLIMSNGEWVIVVDRDMTFTAFDPDGTVVWTMDRQIPGFDSIGRIGPIVGNRLVVAGVDDSGVAAIGVTGIDR